MLAATFVVHEKKSSSTVSSCEEARLRSKSGERRDKCACGEVQTIEHIVRRSKFTMDRLFRVITEAVRLTEKWQSPL